LQQAQLLKTTGKANMIKQHTNGQKFFVGILSLCLGLAFHATAQQRGGGGGGGNFGGGGFGGTTRSGTGTSANSTSRQYPNNTTVGDAYFSIDPETRRVVFIADEATALAMRQVLTNLDRPKPQVLIKCVFLEVTRDDASDIGIEGYYSKNLGNSWNNGSSVTNYSVVSNSIVPTSITPGRGSQFFNGTNLFGLPSPTTFGGANGLYQILGQDFMVTLHAIAQTGKAKVLSRPSILARNNQPATITIGQSIPLITGTTFDSLGNQHNTITWTSIGVILQVTPFITKDGMIEMIVSPQISRLDPTIQIPISATANGTTISTPVIDIRSANTVVDTSDGLPVIIGGLIQNTKTETVTKIPLLGDIPLLGNLFQRKQKDDAKSELIIILTPHVVQATSELAALTAKERDRSGAIQGLTDEELNKYLDERPKKKTSPKAHQKNGKQVAPAPVLPPKDS
jgi:general secretion pathway protein D